MQIFNIKSVKQSNKYSGTLWLIFITIICLNLLFSIQAQTIRIFGPRSEIDPVHHYFVELTKLILSKTGKEHSTNIKLINSLNITQGRILRQFEQGKADILWTATSIEREKRYLAVRIPTLKGLLGYRVILIHQDNQIKFKQIKQAKQLKSLVACQGAHWPDADILTENGFKIERVVHYDAMFKMLARKRCDYFPRGIFEAYAEQKALKIRFPELIVRDDFILHYPFPIYFFVKKGNKKLAQRLKAGLIIAQQDGSWLQLLKQHQVTKHLFPLSQWKNRRFFELINSELPNETPLVNKKLWFDLEAGG